ncbi:permease component of an ABC superfamily antimicrobial peptide transporter [Lacticaseibacillus paracasei]|nr:permease component of an ABC superfamily antimicrobial peptide transporter [Lacticaseibacillus paracasei]
MLTKLALGGLKNRFRDYAVLFSGLVIASAVFYMFMSLATNTSFLKKIRRLALHHLFLVSARCYWPLLRWFISSMPIVFYLACANATMRCL